MAGYELAALLTFGAAWHIDYKEAHPKALASTAEFNGIRSAVMAAAWPLFWSVKLTGRVFFGTPMCPACEA